MRADFSQEAIAELFLTLLHRRAQVRGRYRQKRTIVTDRLRPKAALNEAWISLVAANMHHGAGEVRQQLSIELIEVSNCR
jgi:hypothetical protein